MRRQAAEEEGDSEEADEVDDAPEQEQHQGQREDVEDGPERDGQQHKPRGGPRGRGRDGRGVVRLDGLLEVPCDGGSGNACPPCL